MVTTRGDDDLVALVCGTEQINPALISPEGWARIIRTCADDMPSYLKGLETIQYILHNDGSDPRHLAPEADYSLLLAHQSENVGIDIPKEFVVCDERWPFKKSWHEAPRAHGRLAKLTSEHLLLARDRRLFVLTTKWKPKDRWDTEILASHPLEYWYIVDDGPDGIRIKEADDTALAAWIMKGRARDPGSFRDTVVIHRMHMALSRTANSVRDQYVSLLKKKHGSAERLRRVGHPAA